MLNPRHASYTWSTFLLAPAGKDPWDFQDDARRFVAAHRCGSYCLGCGQQQGRQRQQAVHRMRGSSPLPCAGTLAYLCKPSNSKQCDHHVSCTLPCRALKQGKLDRTEQLEAFINYKEAARAIAEKMSGGKIDWVEEEARARSTIKRSIVRMGEQSSWDQRMEWGQGASLLQSLLV